MAIIQKRSKRKATGGRYRPVPKKKANKGSEPTFTVVGELRQRIKRTRGGEDKITLLAAQKANIFDPKTKKYTIADIKAVVDNGANRNFIRRNIMTKGAIIETSAGKARITSRPGQENNVNAIRIE